MNDAWRLAPWADVLYACDGKWWKYHGDEVAAKFKGERWTTVPDNDPGDHGPMAEKYGLNIVRGTYDYDGIHPAPGHISYGRNSGHQAVHLARNWGAGEIILLGFDFCGNADHFFGMHPQPLQSGHDYNGWLLAMEALAAGLKAEGVRVINCSRTTALRCFERRGIECLKN